MKIPSRALATLLVLPLVLGAAGCSRLRGKQAFKDGNKAYKEENYKKAIEHYERAVRHQSGMAEAYFYLGSAHQALYRPGKDTPENRRHLDEAVANFQKALELNSGSTPMLATVKMNTLAALTGLYSEDPFKNYDEAYKYADQLVQQNPSDPKNLFAMANLFEKFEKVDEAEKMYVRATEVSPADAKACSALAAFYNKPLWEGRSRFDQAIQVLDHCAGLAPEEPAGYYKVAVFYWDKAYRDPLLNDKQKDEYADKGLAAVGRALEIKPDYVDALIYKGLLLRVKAQVTTNARLRAQYLDQAQTLQKQAKDLKQQQQRVAEAQASALGTAQAK
jgi:tetratricopeptide (TPR) repeat protein